MRAARCRLRPALRSRRRHRKPAAPPQYAPVPAERGRGSTRRSQSAASPHGVAPDPWRSLPVQAPCPEPNPGTPGRDQSSRERFRIQGRLSFQPLPNLRPDELLAVARRDRLRDSFHARSDQHIVHHDLAVRKLQSQVIAPLMRSRDEKLTFSHLGQQQGRVRSRQNPTLRSDGIAAVLGRI